MPHEAETPGPDQLKLALERTFLAHERTLMAWIRTSVALITLGFSLYKFFFYLRELEPDRYPEQLLGTRTYGLIMIAVGVATLTLATWQHRRELKRLDVHYPDAPFSLSTVLAILIAGLGILAFGAVIFRQ